jgi:DNA-binding MarR family transcriptional regulator
MPADTLTDVGGAFARLASMPRWVAWRAERRTTGRAAKVPYGTGGRHARANDPGTWVPLPEADALVNRLSQEAAVATGVGIMLGTVSRGWCLGGIDLDACRDPSTGAIEDWAAEMIDVLQTYCEVSPSGRGLHILFAYRAGELPALREAMATDWKRAWRRLAGPTEKAQAIELHLGAGFFTVTGQQLAGTASKIRSLSTDTLLWLVRNAVPRFLQQGAACGAAGLAGVPRAGFLRLPQELLLRLATTLTDPELQVALALAGHSGRQRPKLCRAVLPHGRMLQLPGRNSSSKRGTAALAAAKRGLARRGMLRILRSHTRPKIEGVAGIAAAYDLAFLHTQSSDRQQVAKVRWNRLAVRRAVWSLRPDELRLLVLLLARNGAGGSAEPIRISSREMARQLGTEEMRIARALAGLVEKGWLNVISPQAPRRCGSYRLSTWNDAESTTLYTTPTGSP